MESSNAPARWPATDAGLTAAAGALADGRLVLVPTESSYAVAALVERPDAIARARRAKGRDDAAGKPLLVLCASLDQARSLARLDARALRCAALWPAALTLVLEPADADPAARLGGDGIAVRVPAQAAARRLAELAGPFTGTSANRAGEQPLVDPSAAPHLRLDEPVAGIVDAGVLPGGAPSTLVDMRGGRVEVLRAGAVTEAAILAATR